MICACVCVHVCVCACVHVCDSNCACVFMAISFIKELGSKIRTETNEPHFL